MLAELVFYIIVMAGAKYEPDTNIELDARNRESQKFPCRRTAAAIIGYAKSPPIMQIKDLVM